MRSLMAVLACALVTALAVAPGAGAALHRGDRGTHVAFVQRVLGVHSDGIFGRGTARAVRRFQRGHGLAVDGVVGPGTWSALKRAYRARTPAAGVRSRGRPV